MWRCSCSKSEQARCRWRQDVSSPEWSLCDKTCRCRSDRSVAQRGMDRAPPHGVCASLESVSGAVRTADARLMQWREMSMRRRCAQMLDGATSVRPFAPVGAMQAARTTQREDAHRGCENTERRTHPNPLHHCAHSQQYTLTHMSACRIVHSHRCCALPISPDAPSHCIARGGRARAPSHVSRAHGAQ